MPVELNQLEHERGRLRRQQEHQEAAIVVVNLERANQKKALRPDRHSCVFLELIAYMPRVFEAVHSKSLYITSLHTAMMENRPNSTIHGVPADSRHPECERDR
ncbi:unnamed protein product [Chrysodeixis includens]|uniref:Uncharacterized protein n=1 Tax=Chrysodeixis includens TaxID=689277 RepID=A0A9N8L032_CHRIL|nr:unnamed protein product [Chrysodeixis includens]